MHIAHLLCWKIPDWRPHVHLRYYNQFFYNQKNGFLESQTNVSCVLNLISKDYLPVLKQRSVKDMAMVLQYGIANIVNAALRLLEVCIRVQNVCSSRIRTKKADYRFLFAG